MAAEEEEASARPCLGQMSLRMALSRLSGCVSVTSNVRSTTHTSIASPISTSAPKPAISAMITGRRPAPPVSSSIDTRASRAVTAIVLPASCATASAAAAAARAESSAAACVRVVDALEAMLIVRFSPGPGGKGAGARFVGVAAFSSSKRTSAP